MIIIKSEWGWGWGCGSAYGYAYRYENGHGGVYVDLEKHIVDAYRGKLWEKEDRAGQEWRGQERTGEESE